MKKILAVLLAVAMVLAGGTAAFAAEDEIIIPQEEEYPVIQMLGYDGYVNPGETVYVNIPVNGRVQSARLYCNTLWNIDKVTFQQGKLVEGDIRYGSDFVIDIFTKSEERKVGTIIEDTIIVYLGNGQQYTFPIVATIIDNIVIDLRDEKGNYLVSPNRLSYNPDIELGENKTYNLVAEIMDITADNPDPDYVYGVSGGCNREVYNGRLKATLGTVTRRGKEIYIPVTVSSPGDWSYDFPITVTVKKGDSDPVERTFWFAVLYGAGSVPPAGSGNSDNTNSTTNNTTTNKTTTVTKEKESAHVSSNEAAENDALKSIERTNKALQAAAESGSSVSSSKVQSYIAADGASVPAVSVKLYGFGAGLSLETMRTLAEGSTGLRVNLDNGAAQVLIPAGFPMPNIPGVLGYALGYQKEPSWEGNLMRALVKDPNALTETHRLGGGELPVAATVTLKTKLSGPVNVYYWDASTRKAAFLASGNAQNGKVSFATKQLGNLIVTNGTI